MFQITPRTKFRFNTDKGFCGSDMKKEEPVFDGGFLQFKRMGREYLFVGTDSYGVSHFSNLDAASDYLCIAGESKEVSDFSVSAVKTKESEEIVSFCTAANKKFDNNSSLIKVEIPDNLRLSDSFDSYMKSLDITFGSNYEINMLDSRHVSLGKIKVSVGGRCRDVVSIAVVPMQESKSVGFVNTCRVYKYSFGGTLFSNRT